LPESALESAAMPQLADVINHALEVRAPCPELEPALAEFFAELSGDDTSDQFHPHPLTADEAARRCRYSGKDLYYLLISGQQVLGYGMLRGWDEGYEIPSLGIAIRASARGKGLAGLLLNFLHGAASWHGANKVMLKVYPDNLPARRLYEQLGYTFTNEGEGQLLGSIDL